MQHILNAYLRRLTNLTANNRSLLLLRLISDQFMDLHDFHYAENQTSFELVEALIARKPRIKLCPVLDSREQANNALSKRLKKLQRIERFIFEERGSKDLYVGWPYLRGKLQNDVLVRAPLLFFPVALEEDGYHWYLKSRVDVNVTFNKTLLLAYAHYNEIKLDDDLLEMTLDTLEKDSRVFRTELYKIFRDSPVELHFNQENFVDKLQAFQNYKRAKLEKQEETGRLKLYPEAVIGIYPQAGSYLVPDYMHLLEQPDLPGLEAFFMSHQARKDPQPQPPPTSAPPQNPHFSFDYLGRIKEEATITPLAIDAYQENAIKAVKNGQSLVVQGPPGTGKSQMIANLVADTIAKGQKVLLVCQKKAALDVVYQRLSQLDIDDFLGLVHDFKDDRKEVYEKVKRQIDCLHEYRQRNSSLDAITIERTFLQTSRKIDATTEELEELKSALFNTQECGLSAKELYLTSSPHQPAISLKQEYRFLPFDSVHSFEEKLNVYKQYANRFDHPDHPWQERRSFSGYTISHMQQIRQMLLQVRQYQQEKGTAASPYTGQPLGLPALQAIYAQKEALQQMFALLEQPMVYNFFVHILQFKSIKPDKLFFSNMERVLMESFVGAGVETSLKSSELGQFQQVLQERTDANNSPVSRLNWKLFNPKKGWLKQVLQANNLKNTRADLKILERKLDNRLNLEHNLTKLKERKWPKDIPQNYNPTDFQRWFHWQKQALEALNIFRSIRGFETFFEPKANQLEAFQKPIKQLLALLQDIPDIVAQWQQFLTPGQLTHLYENEEAPQQLVKALETDFEDLRLYDELLHNLQSHEKNIIDRLQVFEDDWQENQQKQEGPPTSPPAWQSVFQNSLRLAWIEHLETKYPVLRLVSSIQIENKVQDLTEAVALKQSLSKEILLLRAREQTYAQLEYNRLNNRVTYRDLEHQVTKKRQIWPLRKLIQQFGEELFRLIPCWMASPESVSAMFPMEELFDLVIFDEASQCFAEKGIPAMYRGRQVVVTGDDKQLAPNDLYKVRWEEDGPDTPDLEVESLLDLANRYLQQVVLRGHYRSATPELIAFSNQHFYNHSLSVLPQRAALQQSKPSIDFIKVPGIWHKQSNEAEAQKVIALLLALKKESPQTTAAVVTFNAAQQGLIMDLLEQQDIKPAMLPPRTFVKNIENVQGDERDVVFFSVGYAPDEDGKLKMQFGTLNQKAGENRLNVAITRARQQVVVVTSVEPAMLKTEGLTNQGPALLKAYLQFAQQVSQGQFKVTLNKAPKGFTTQWFLRHQLEQWSQSNTNLPYQLVQELPFADLTVKQQEQYLGLILTDDDALKNSISAKDAFVYKPGTLLNQGWQSKQLFSRNYWQQPQEQKEKLERFIHLHYVQR